MWPLKVESDCSMLCSSPMSARTSSKTGRRLAVLGGDGQAGLGHEHEQADRLERYGLAAGVGSGDEQDARLAAEGDRNRDWGRQQWVAGLDQVESAGMRWSQRSAGTSPGRQSWS